jgi:predicted flap endonuclease-1-like 5' DNA nuclease
MLQKVNLVNLQDKYSAAQEELDAAKAAKAAGSAAAFTAPAESPAAAPEQSAPTRAAQIVPEEPPAFEPAVSFAAPAVERDDLVVINGIGPVIAGKLYQAGISTFADLAALTPARLRELVGDTISRLADEESIIEQAKQLAAKKQGG